jgi:hypothetical protein
LTNEHRSIAMADVQGPQSVEHLASATATFALGFLQACLSTSGVTLKQAETKLENGMSFTQLCEELNSRVSLLVESAESGRREAESSISLLQREIVELVEQARYGLLTNEARPTAVT